MYNVIEKEITKEYMQELDRKRKFIPITFDYMFKGLFTKNLDLLKKFILSQLEINIKEEECNIKILNNELTKENKKEYKKTVDLYIKINNCIFVNIEVNREYFNNVKLRNIMYDNKLYSMFLESGEDISSLKDKTLIQLNLCAQKGLQI